MRRMKNCLPDLTYAPAGRRNALSVAGEAERWILDRNNIGGKNHEVSTLQRAHGW